LQVTKLKYASFGMRVSATPELVPFPDNRWQSRGDASCSRLVGTVEKDFSCQKNGHQRTSMQRRVAILEKRQLVEIYIEREKEFALVGSITKADHPRFNPHGSLHSWISAGR